MSETTGKTSEYQWQYRSVTTQSPPPAAGQQLQQTPHKYEQLAQPLSDSSRPLRSHRSLPYALDRPGRPQGSNRAHVGAPALAGLDHRAVVQGPQPAGPTNLPPPTFGGSVPHSPTGRLTPNSPGAGPSDEQLEDEDVEYGSGEQDEGEERPSMTAAELRAHKRKMKRFR